jgi:pyruvate formate lyase activating enzyme
MSNIKGFQPVSLVDYPDNLAAIIFLGGCNFLCSFCHNPELVLCPGKVESISKEEIFAILKKRKSLLDGVVITGGEPCLSEGVLDLIRDIKELGLKVKLDTNGTRPHVLEKALTMVDYVAMDIKSSLGGYEKACGVKVNLENIKKSVELIQRSGKEYEFRTTMVRSLVGKEDIKEICSWLKGSKKFALQQFNKKGLLLNDEIKNNQLYLKEELEEFKEVCKEFFDLVEVRNI